MDIKETCENLAGVYAKTDNLPNAGDNGAWSELDNELSDALSTLPDYKDIQIERREKFIFNYLNEKFGVKKSGTSSDLGKWPSLANKTSLGDWKKT